MSLADELLSRWAPIMAAVELLTGQKGRFEVSLDGELIFSKAAEGRFPDDGEMVRRMEEKLGPALAWRRQHS